MGIVEYISRRPNQKAKKVSAYDQEFIVAKLKIISVSIISLELNTTRPAPHLHQLLKTNDPALQITPKIEVNSMAINLISAHAARLHKHGFYNFSAPRNTNCNLNY